jgi:CTP-dependent riboflavin kinase
LVSIVFIINKDKISKSIDGAIRAVDKLCNELNIECDLSHMTKYRVISNLLKNKILVSRKTKKNKKVKLSKKIIELL